MTKIVAQDTQKPIGEGGKLKWEETSSRMGTILSQFEASNLISVVTAIPNHVLSTDHRVMEEDVTHGATLTHE